MRIRTGDMWTALSHVDHFIITTNAVIKANGALVMGAGIAKQCRDMFKDIDKTIGKAISYHKARCGTNKYGVILGRKIGIFQVKLHFKDNADLDLIRLSTQMLTALANDNPSKTYALNFPGIGNGRMASAYEEILQIISTLPDNVEVWKFK